MNQFLVMLNNRWTTIAGVAFGVGQYLAQWGPVAPSAQTASSFWFGLALVIIGLLSKDATTGSTPGQVPQPGPNPANAPVAGNARRR